MVKPEGVLAVIDRARNLLPNGKTAKMPVTFDNGFEALEAKQNNKRYKNSLIELAAASYSRIIAHTRLSWANRFNAGTEVEENYRSMVAWRSLNLLAFGKGSIVRTNRAFATMNVFLEKFQISEDVQKTIHRLGEERLIDLARTLEVSLPGVTLTDEGGYINIEELDPLGIVKAVHGKLQGSDRGIKPARNGLVAAIFVCQVSKEGRDKIVAFINDTDSLNICAPGEI